MRSTAAENSGGGEAEGAAPAAGTSSVNQKYSETNTEVQLYIHQIQYRTGSVWGPKGTVGETWPDLGVFCTIAAHPFARFLCRK